ncbi:MAG: carbon-nitrogen hydrolase family protein [Firmicutes bacterium]|nr:carbon-nitrogen hydrolase family protein [Bacillota bacterium]
MRGRALRVAVCQTAAALGRAEENAARLAERIRALGAADPPPDLALFPELALTGYVAGPRAHRALGGAGEALARVAQAAAAAGVAVVVGNAEEDASLPGVVYDSLYLIDPTGRERARYRKRFLWQEEQLAYARGHESAVAAVAGVRIGLGVCWDLAFPEWSRPLALGGAELLAVGAAWDRADIGLFELFARARAAENACYLAVANRVGRDGHVAFGGRSQVVGPDGRVLARAGAREEACLTVELDLERVAEERAEHNPYLRDLDAALGRRPGAGEGWGL